MHVVQNSQVIDMCRSGHIDTEIRCCNINLSTQTKRSRGALSDLHQLMSSTDRCGLTCHDHHTFVHIVDIVPIVDKGQAILFLLCPGVWSATTALDTESIACSWYRRRHDGRAVERRGVGV